MDFRVDMNFEQMRFYCYKKILGKVFYVVIKINFLGEVVVQYFIGKIIILFQVCDLFLMFLDDNLMFFFKCVEWGIC